MRAPVYSGKNGASQLPRPPQPMRPTSTAEFACEPKTVAGFKIKRPAAAVLTKSRRSGSVLLLMFASIARV
jgi:hypothetical protein